MIIALGSLSNKYSGTSELKTSVGAWFVVHYFGSPLLGVFAKRPFLCVEISVYRGVYR